MLKNGLTVSVVVPIYNEEKTLKGVIDTLLQGELFDEIICVNDGSTDSSKKILDSLDSKVTVIHLKENKGKGYALVTGAKKATGELIFFLDADFESPKIEQLYKLLDPMLDESVFATVGSLWESKLEKIIKDPFNGQRVYYKKDIEPLFDQMKDSRWGVELVLNKAFRDKNVELVFLEEMGHLQKHHKHNKKEALKEYIQEGVEIANELVPSKKLNEEDTKIFRLLTKSKNLVEFDNLVSKIKNDKLRGVLKDYLIKYLGN